MGTVLLVLVVVLVVAALVFGVVSMLAGDDPGLSPADPDSRAVALPNNRSLAEDDIKGIRFDLAVRGYRMSQVDRALRRTAYDIGYKDEMIAVLEAEVAALRDGRIEDADLLRKARESAANPAPAASGATAAGADLDGSGGSDHALAGAEAAGAAAEDARTADSAGSHDNAAQPDGAQSGDVPPDADAPEGVQLDAPGGEAVDEGDAHGAADPADVVQASGDRGSDAEGSIERARG